MANNKTYNSKKKNPPPSSKKSRPVYCVVCRSNYLKHAGHDHMHSMLHHRELEAATDKKELHTCQACDMSSMSLQQYAEHITTAQHKANFKILISKNVKPLSVERLLGVETFNMILKRNKSLRRKQRGKGKKKQKQMAWQKSAGLKTEGKNTEASSVQKKRVSKPMHAAPKESNNAVFQNIENKVSPLQRLHWHAQSYPQTMRGAHMPRWPVHPPGHHSSSLHHGNQPACHVRYNDNLSVNSPHSSSQAWGAQSESYHRRPCSFHMGASRMQQPQPWPTVGQYYSTTEQQHDHAAEEDFSKDYFPQGRSFFNQDQAVSLPSSQPHRSARPTSAKPPVSTAPIKDADVSVMLRQIRRALGVREPCRADREAQKQNSEASNHVSDSGTASKPARAEIEQSGNSSISTTSGPSAQVNSISFAEPKNNKTQELGQNGSVAVNGLLGGKERESLLTTDSETSLSQSTIKTTLCEPTNSKGKVRIAHNSAKAQQLMKTKLQQTLQKLQTSLSGANCKPRSRMNDGAKMQKIKSTPRFATNMNMNCVQDQQRSTQPLDNDLSLSEGFQWEAFSNSPSASHLTLQPASQHTADTDCHTQSGSLTQNPLERPEATQQGCSQTETRPSINVEPNESQDSRENSGVSKRKSYMVADDGSPDKEQRKKKTKLNNDQDQMDQLLAVSLREEEVSHSMVVLDKSLIQARNALQAAYAEVQRLMILRQQFTAEVNTLRAKRIEILQGMQEVYSETSNVTEKATTSSAAASSAFHTFSSQPSPATTAAASIAVPQPAPIALSGIKQEGRPSPRTVSHTTDASPSHSATSTAAAPAKQPKAQCSPSLKAHIPTESSVWQQEKETGDGSQDSMRMETLAKEAQPAENVEETRGNPSKASLADKPDAEGVKIISIADSDGNESDASIEMVSYSAQEIIDIDESDKEDSPSAQEVPQTSVTVESTTTGTQTCLQMEAERNYKPSAVPVKYANSPAAPVEDKEPSLGAFLNHIRSVHGLQVHEGRLYTCSGDNTARAYSLATRECLTVFEGHTNKVNCLLVSSFPNMPARLYTGSSDQTICRFSIKTNKCLEQISLPDRVLCLHIAWNILYAGLANGSVVSYDLKTLKQLDVFECHGPRGVSCLGTTQEGARRLLLVGSYDSTISVRDAKSGVLLRSLEGHTKTVLCMKVVNDLVFSGSSDTSVHAHNIHTGELVRIYKGHGHAVTSIVILGKVMVTACLDKLVRVYELQSHDRLQVYGGHSDMVLCMAVHKSVIYTGCYDGTIQAVKLNLMKNHRCWWQNCSLIFGMADHLVHHLVNDHGNPNLQTMKCRWRGCDTFFSSQQSVQQNAPEHMQLHVQNDSTLQP